MQTPPKTCDISQLQHRESGGILSMVDANRCSLTCLHKRADLNSVIFADRPCGQVSRRIDQANNEKGHLRRCRWPFLMFIVPRFITIRPVIQAMAIGTNSHQIFGGIIGMITVFVMDL